MSVERVATLFARERRHSVFMAEIWDWRLNIWLPRRESERMVVQAVEVVWLVSDTAGGT